MLPSYDIIVCWPGVQERPVAIVNVLAPTVIECESDAVDVNKSPFIPDVPEVPEVPPLPAVPLVPAIPDVPIMDIPDVPPLPAVPVVPLVPDVPDVPDAICAWRKSKLSSISTAVSGDPFDRRLINAILYYSLYI